MITRRDWLPQNHEALFDKANLTFNYILEPANRARMGFAAGSPQGIWLDTEAVPAWRAFSAAFTNWLNPAERTRGKTIVLAEAEKAFAAVYRRLYTGLLKGNPLVAEVDLNRMGLPLSSSARHDAPVATDAPGVNVDTSVLGRLTLRFFRRGGSHKRGKPVGQHCVNICWAILDTPPTDLDALVHSEVATTALFTFEFDYNQRGKIVYFVLRWENTRGGKGPWSDIHSAIIP
jgi:hypothetical protein